MHASYVTFITVDEKMKHKYVINIVESLKTFCRCNEIVKICKRHLRFDTWLGFLFIVGSFSILFLCFGRSFLIILIINLRLIRRRMIAVRIIGRIVLLISVFLLRIIVRLFGFLLSYILLFGMRIQNNEIIIISIFD